MPQTPNKKETGQNGRDEELPALQSGIRRGAAAMGTWEGATAWEDEWLDYVIVLIRATMAEEHRLLTEDPRVRRLIGLWDDSQKGQPLMATPEQAQRDLAELEADMCSLREAAKVLQEYLDNLIETYDPALASEEVARAMEDALTTIEKLDSLFSCFDIAKLVNDNAAKRST